MKETILALVALAVGIGLGLYTTWREFGGEKLPSKISLAVLNEKSSSLDASHGPRLVVEGGEIFDFGTMDRGTVGHHDFVFRNMGDAPLVLTMDATTCKCTAAAAGGKKLEKGDHQTVPPGEAFKISLDWTIKTQDKDFSQSAEFKTSDPRREVVRLLVHGRTVSAIDTEELELRFPNVSANEPAVAEMNLYYYREQELKILEHHWTSQETQDLFNVSFLPLPPEDAVKRGARGGLRMRVTLKPGLPLGQTRQGIRLTTNYEGVEAVTIPMDIVVVGDLTLLGPKVVPNSTKIDLAAVEQKTGISHTVYLLIKGPHRDQTQVQIAHVEPTQWLKVSLGEPLTDSPKIKRIPIKIEIPPGAPLGNFLGSSDGKTGQIILRTTHPQIKQIVIPVLFIVRD